MRRESVRLAAAVRAIRFYYDVVCPYSYMESHAVEAAEDAGEVEVKWLPFELRPAPRPLLEVRGDHLRVDWTNTSMRERCRLGIEIHLPRYQPRSTLPARRVPLGGEQGRLREYKHALYEAFFCEGEDIATDREIARAAERAGLDPDAAVAAAYSAERFDRIGAIRREAEAAGIRGVPSLLTERGESHWGMGGLARLFAGEPLIPRTTLTELEHVDDTERQLDAHLAHQLRSAGHLSGLQVAVEALAVGPERHELSLSVLDEQRRAQHGRRPGRPGLAHQLGEPLGLVRGELRFEDRRDHVEIIFFHPGRPRCSASYAAWLN